MAKSRFFAVPEIALVVDPGFKVIDHFHMLRSIDMVLDIPILHGLMHE